MPQPVRGDMTTSPVSIHRRGQIWQQVWQPAASVQGSTGKLSKVRSTRSPATEAGAVNRSCMRGGTRHLTRSTGSRRSGKDEAAADG